MLPRSHPDGIHIAFDDHRLVPFPVFCLPRFCLNSLVCRSVINGTSAE